MPHATRNQRKTNDLLALQASIKISPTNNDNNTQPATIQDQSHL